MTQKSLMNTLRIMLDREHLYRQEIEELTDFIRNDEDWSDLRDRVTEKGFNLNSTFLVHFVEDEKSNEYGAIVTTDKKAYEYTRSTDTNKNNADHFELTEITGNDELLDGYPQIKVAFKMIDEGIE